MNSKTLKDLKIQDMNPDNPWDCGYIQCWNNVKSVLKDSKLYCLEDDIGCHWSCGFGSFTGCVNTEPCRHQVIILQQILGDDE
jgi:hypothetical protein